MLKIIDSESFRTEVGFCLGETADEIKRGALVFVQFTCKLFDGRLVQKHFDCGLGAQGDDVASFMDCVFEVIDNSQLQYFGVTLKFAAGGVSLQGFFVDSSASKHAVVLH